MTQNKSNNNKKIYFELFICLFITSLVFVPTLNRPWLLYDENVLFTGKYFPSTNSLNEFIEIISTFGVNFHVISSNTMYSANHVTRSTPLGQIFGMIISSFFNKDPFLFHTFNFSLHLINTVLFFSILRKFISTSFFVTIITIIWAIHPLMIEPILLSTNCGATFSYMFFFAFLLDFITNKESNNKKIRLLLIPTLFLIPMLMNEYIVTLPLVLFIFSFTNNFEKGSFLNSLKKSFKETMPYFIGLAIYMLYFFLIANFKSSHHSEGNEILLLLERIFWLSPQIFFHLISLLFYPKLLSIDQTIFVRLGTELFDSYAIFCFLFLTAWLAIPFYFFIFKKKYKILFLTAWGFFFTLLPFLHILMPSYTLAAERYMYAPTGIFLLGFGVCLNYLSNKKTAKILISLFLLTIVLLCYSRSYSRGLDWKDNYAFINSTYNISSDPLSKAIKLGMLGKTTSIFEPAQKEKIKNYFIETISLLNQAKVNMKEKKLKYQNKTPLIIKSYGLDYDSLLTKICFLEVASKCIELKEDYKIGLQILEANISDFEKVNPSIIEMYAYFLILDKRFEEAESILLKSINSYPKDTLILDKLIDISTSYNNDLNKAENYLLEELNFYPYDPDILLKAIRFYAMKKDLYKLAKYSYLYGLRTQSIDGYIQALTLYARLPNEKEMLMKIKNKLLKLAPNNREVMELIQKYNLN